MYKIVKARRLADKIFLMDVHAPRVASHCQPGQFIIVKMDEKGERIPLTICDYDREAGTITIVVQEVGASTTKMGELKEGDYFRDFTGPLGCPSEFVEEDLETLKKKKMLFVAGGVGAAPVYPQVKWLREHGIEADVIVGSKTKDMLILEDEMKAVAGNYYPCTDDGSYGHAGMVTTMIEELVGEGKKYDVCVAIGPMIMMKFVCLLTKKLEIPTIDGKVKYTIPEGTQSGTTFRLKGKGIPGLNGRGRGDQYVTVYIETPRNLNREQKEALKKFSESLGEKNYEEHKSFFGKFKL